MKLENKKAVAGTTTIKFKYKSLYHRRWKMKRLLLDYGCGSVEYINVRNFEIKYPFIIIDNNKISLWDVEFIKYKNFIAWKNRRKK